jgi:HAMP domain-containing protein
MNLQAKFSLIFLLVFGVQLAVAGYVCDGFLQRSARDQVIHQARLMMESSLAARTYTDEQIKPLVHRNDPAFHPQIVPGYAATEHFNYFRNAYPEYSYKEATLNPTNPRDRAVDWEADVVKWFRDNPDKNDFSGERGTPMGRSLFLARPIKALASCLVCHSTPDVAPANMVKVYGTANGFGWKENEIIGAQIVSVPMALPIRMADAAYRQLMTYLVVIAIVTLVVLNLALHFAVIRPVRRFSVMADEISKGNLDFPELPATGKDEISVLAGSFNRMHRSLARAMKMLDRN